MQDEVKVREIETVAGDFLTEAGVPFYRVEIDGFCADFDYREAAENFANAINQMVARHRHQAERDTLARIEPVAWMYEREGQLKTPLIERAQHMTEYGWTEHALGIIPAPEDK